MMQDLYGKHEALSLILSTKRKVLELTLRISVVASLDAVTLSSSKVCFLYLNLSCLAYVEKFLFKLTAQRSS